MTPCWSRTATSSTRSAPLDLQGWQNLPVSAIANPRPVVVTDLSPAALTAVVDRHPYAHFPVVREGCLIGVVSRADVLAAGSAGGDPVVHRALTCHPDQTVREIGDKFIESPANILVVVDRDREAVVGIVTLHDLIRAQAAIQS